MYPALDPTDMAEKTAGGRMLGPRKLIVLTEKLCDVLRLVLSQVSGAFSKGCLMSDAFTLGK